VSAGKRVILGGAEVDLVNRDDALAVISHHLNDRTSPPLGVISINLDHLHHLATDERFALGLLPRSGIDWLSLIDGAPIAAEAGRLTGTSWPRLAGSDLILPILDSLEASGARLGVLGGTAETHRQLRDRLSASRPDLVVAGCWAPERVELADSASSARLATEIAEAGVDVLLVALGKPRQEKWIAEWGAETRSRVLLAFGAVVDFLAGRIVRAPELVARAGMEWAWRLAIEPRRLARRYLLEGPPSYLALRRHSAAFEHLRHQTGPASVTSRRFRTATEAADAAVIIVTYNSAADIERLLESLRDQCDRLALRVIVVDNSSKDGTLDLVRLQDDVIAIAAGGNLGYAGGINAAQPLSVGAETILVLNPDLAAAPGSVAAMLARLHTSGAGAVVPLLTNASGDTSPSLRREPGVRRALGDAIAGGQWPGRPGWLSETDWAPLSYRYAHPVEWATGAALMVRADVAARVGAWDDRFFLYSEETDFFRRIREIGEQIWFEPAAVMEHAQGGSGSSGALLALMEVNKVRYFEKHASAARAGLFRGALVLHQLLRLGRPERRAAARTLLNRRSWGSLPAAKRDSE